MKKILNISLMIVLLVALTACGCNKDKKPYDVPEPSGGGGTGSKPHFDYVEVMFDNPSEWPTDTFFSNVPAVATNVDDLTHVIHGDNADKEIYTLTIKVMNYATFKAYTDTLISSGFSCSRAGYWLPDSEENLSNNYSQCVANSRGVYIKANWYKSSANSFNFQMQIANYDMDANK